MEKTPKVVVKIKKTLKLLWKSKKCFNPTLFVFDIVVVCARPKEQFRGNPLRTKICDSVPAAMLATLRKLGAALAHQKYRPANKLCEHQIVHMFAGKYTHCV